MGLRFHPKFILRSPSLSFLSKDAHLDGIIYKQDFQEAIYLASPVLFDELIKLITNKLKTSKEQEKVKLSLEKYLSRMKSRATPFGLFATCSTGRWEDKNDVVLENPPRRSTRLDFSFMVKLTQHLANLEILKPYLLFYPNNSIYRIGKEIRYAEYTIRSESRRYNIESVEQSDHLSRILELSKGGATIKELAHSIIGNGINESEAEEFVLEVVNVQLLCCELEPSIIGDEAIHTLIGRLREINTVANEEYLKELISLLENVKLKLSDLDQHFGNSIDKYRNLLNDFRHAKIGFDEKYVFQVDSFRKGSPAMLNVSIQKKIVETVDFLKAIALPLNTQDLDNFKAKFKEFYEERTMPLLQVLDTETGIGYPNRDTVGLSELVDDLPMRNIRELTGRIVWNSRERMIFEKLSKAIATNEAVVQFSEEDTKGLPKQDAILPDTLPILFKLIDNRNERIWIRSIGGSSSASNLLSRFATGDKEILEIITEISSFEQGKCKNEVIGEIVHLPEGRLGNVLARPKVRAYEIPYLGKGGGPINEQIPLEDIEVSIVNNKVILFSKKLQRKIIPRLSTAHNYSANSLPVYKFLCDLQFQETTHPHLSFNWGGFSRGHKFLPRAEYNDVVLFPATWQLEAIDFNPLFADSKKSELLTLVELWRNQWKMPQYVLLNDSDNTLLVDFCDEISISVFLSTIKRRPRIELSEFIFDFNDPLVRDGSGNPFTHELIGILFNEESRESQLKQSRSYLSGNNGGIGKSSLQRTFAPGSEWIYVKIYCGIKTAENLLSQGINQISKDLINSGKVSKLFFVRYADPENHIRLRLLAKDLSTFGEIVAQLNSFLNPFVQSGIVLKVQLDTYTRELERYGSEVMELCESIFYYDSISVMAMLNIVQEDDNEEIRLLFAAMCVDHLFECFQCNEKEKSRIIETLRENYFIEHGAQKQFKLRLDKKYRKLRHTLEGFLDRRNKDPLQFRPLYQCLDWRRDKLRPIIESIIQINEGKGRSIDALLTHLNHMTINRIFKSRQRTFELIIYDLLCRYYTSRRARTKNSEGIKASL